MSEIDLTQFEGHTPGPWKVGYRALDIWAPSEKGGEAKIFDVRGWGYLTGKGDGALGLSEDQAIAIQTANANIAAAAPDLLAAYKAALARVKILERKLEVLSQSHMAIACQLADEHRRVKAANTERLTWFEQYLDADVKRATAERECREAIAASDARAEAMREAAASKANDMGDWGIYEAILALPIPAQEVK